MWLCARDSGNWISDWEGTFWIKKFGIGYLTAGKGKRNFWEYDGRKEIKEKGKSMSKMCN